MRIFVKGQGRHGGGFRGRGRYGDREREGAFPGGDRGFRGAGEREQGRYGNESRGGNGERFMRHRSHPERSMRDDEFQGRGFGGGRPLRGGRGRGFRAEANRERPFLEYNNEMEEAGARLFQAARAFYEAAQALYRDGNRRDGERTELAEINTTARVSVCMGRACQTRFDSAALFNDLSLAASQTGHAITVDTCRCLNLCDEGPVVVASPAVDFTSSTGTPTERVFVNVEKRDIQDIIDAVKDRQQ